MKYNIYIYCFTINLILYNKLTNKQSNLSQLVMENLTYHHVDLSICSNKLIISIRILNQYLNLSKKFYIICNIVVYNDYFVLIII